MFTNTPRRWTNEPHYEVIGSRVVAAFAVATVGQLVALLGLWWVGEADIALCLALLSFIALNVLCEIALARYRTTPWIELARSCLLVPAGLALALQANAPMVFVFAIYLGLILGTPVHLNQHPRFSAWSPWFTGLHLACFATAAYLRQGWVAAPGPYTAGVGILALGAMALMQHQLIKLFTKTQRQRLTAEQQMVQTARMRSLGEMSGGMAHEINNPLAIIAGKSRRLARQFADSDPTGALGKELAAIDVATKRIAEVLNSLLRFSGQKEHSPAEPVDIDALLQEVQTLCRGQLRSAGVELSCQATPGLQVYGSSSELTQSLINLLTNGMEAAQQQQERWVHIHAEAIADKVQIRIVDSGHGLTPEVSEHMFVPFFSTKPVGSGHGLGLGLSIAATILTEHKGSLTVDPSAKHTTFVASLPRLSPVRHAG